MSILQQAWAVPVYGYIFVIALAVYLAVICDFQFLMYNYDVMYVLSSPPDKMLSYRRETVLQGALVLAKSGRL